MKQLIWFFIFLPVSVFGQEAKDIFSLTIGNGSTNITFKEAFEPSINFFGRIFNTGKNFVGDGPECGISNEISQRIFMDFSFSLFSGRNSKANYQQY